MGSVCRSSTLPCGPATEPSVGLGTSAFPLYIAVFEVKLFLCLGTEYVEHPRSYRVLVLNFLYFFLWERGEMLHAL